MKRLTRNSMNSTKRRGSRRSRASAARRSLTAQRTLLWRFPTGTRITRKKPTTEGRSMAKNTILCGLVFLAALLLLPVQAVDAEREIVRAEAKHLVKIWLASQGYDTRSWRFVLDADPDQNEFPSFYFFSANFVQEQSAPTLGH